MAEAEEDWSNLVRLTLRLSWDGIDGRGVLISIAKMKES
jgi:hypothetical protein